MFPRSCMCCPSSFAAPVDVDGGERHFEFSVDAHAHWCPVGERSRSLLPDEEKSNVRIFENPTPSGQVAAELKRFTREELETLIQEQLQRRLRENHRANQLRNQIDHTEAILDKYRRHLDALQKHINDLSVVTHNYTNQSQPDGKPPMKLARNVGLQARIKPHPKEENEFGDVVIEHDVPVPPGESTAIRRPASDGKTGEVNVAMAADGQTALDSLDGPRVGVLASEGGSIGRSLENRSASPETTPPVTPCSVVLTRSAELDAYAKSLADSAPNQLNDNAGLKVSPAVEVDLTLTDEEEETADITLQLVPKQAHQHLKDTDLNSPLTGAQVKRSRNVAGVNERSVTDEADGPTDPKRRKPCHSPQAVDTANSADSPFIRPGSVPGNPRGTPTSDNSFQPRVPVIISVTSVANPRTSSAPWSSKMMAHKARAPQNMMYHKWKLPAPNDGLLTSASACRASPVPSPVASPGSSQISPALKAGVLLDLSTKNNERKPVQIILKPRLSNSQPVRPVARHPLPDLVTPKVIITPLPPRHSNGNGQLTSLLPLEPAKISVVEQPNEKCPPEGGGLKSQADPQLPARASPQIKPEINLTRSHVRRSLPALQATSSSYSQLTNRPDKSFRSIPSNVESAFQRVMPSNSTLMPYPSVQQRSMLLPFIYPGYLGPTFGLPNAVRPFRSVSPMPLPVHSLNAALFRPRTPYPCREAMLRQNEPVALLKGSSTPVWSGSLPLDRSAKSQPQSSKQSVNPTQVPIQSASLKGPGVKRALPGLMPISSCAAKKHPAPLPAHLNDQHQLLSQFFKPVVTIKRVPDGIEIKWTIPQLARNQLDEITHYELYSYQDCPDAVPSPDLWKQVGSIRALALPMGCTLSKFAKGFVYHFTLRGMLRHGGAQKANGSPFSELTSILYE